MNNDLVVAILIALIVFLFLGILFSSGNTKTKSHKKSFNTSYENKDYSLYQKYFGLYSFYSNSYTIQRLEFFLYLIIFGIVSWIVGYLLGYFYGVNLYQPGRIIPSYNLFTWISYLYFIYIANVVGYKRFRDTGLTNVVFFIVLGNSFFISTALTVLMYSFGINLEFFIIIFGGILNFLFNLFLLFCPSKSFNKEPSKNTYEKSPIKSTKMSNEDTLAPSKYEEEQKDSQFNENEIYEQISNELDAGTHQKGLWTKAIAEAEGNESKVKAIYIKLRFNQIKEEEKKERERKANFERIKNSK